MAMIDYTPPTSWDDKEMDWSDPDPGKADYILALRAAVTERLAAVGSGHSTYVGHFLQGGAPLTPLVFIRQAEALQQELKAICPHFINWEKTTASDRDTVAIGRFEENLTVKWTWNQLLEEFPALGVIPGRGSPQPRYKGFLRACKEALDKLHVTTTGAKGKGRHRGVSFDYKESIMEGSYNGASSEIAAYNQSVSRARGNRDEYEHKLVVGGGDNFVTNIVSITDASRYEIEIDGQKVLRYTSRARTREIEFTRMALNPLAGRSVSLILVVVANRPSASNEYFDDDVFEDPIFAADGFGFTEGMNIVPVAVARQTPADLVKRLGSETSFQPYTGVSRNDAIRYTGFEANVYIFCDHGVDGGFKFFAGGDLV